MIYLKTLHARKVCENSNCISLRKLSSRGEKLDIVSTNAAYQLFQSFGGAFSEMLSIKGKIARRIFV